MYLFFWLNTGKNADSYIIKNPSLSSTTEYNDEPEATLSPWSGPILFLPHQTNAMDHSWLFTMDHICKNKKPCLYVHKKTSTKLCRPSNPSLGKWKKYIFHICILPIIFYKLASPKYSSSSQGLLWVQIFQCTSIAWVSQVHNDFDHNENNLIYSKVIRLTRK